MNPEQYRKAKKRVKKKKEFRDHLKSFIGVNLMMLGMGWMFGFYKAWLIVVFFWGIGIVSHYVDVYGFPGFANDEDWERRELEKEMQRMELPDTDDEPDELLDLDLPRPVKRKNYNEEDFV